MKITNKLRFGFLAAFILLAFVELYTGNNISSLDDHYHRVEERIIPDLIQVTEISKIAKENKIVLSYLNKDTGKRAKKTLQQLIDECKEKKLI